MSNKNNFKNKIECIYEYICQKDIDKLTELFLNETDFNNRKIHIEQKWLKKDLTPRLFKKEYPNYKFSNLTINDKKLFKNATEFLEIGLDAFCKKIKEYATINQVQNISLLDNYPYLYMPNYINREFFIDYYQINYLDNIEPNKIEIEAIPPKRKSNFHIQKYNGFYLIKKDFYVFKLKNDFDYIIAIFNTDYINKNIDYIVGLSIGIADTNKKNVVAKKAIISKHKFDNNELKEIYLTLNESEMLDTKENLFYLDSSENNLNLMHLKKYYNKIDRFRALFCNLIDSYPFFKKFYYQTALSRFINVSTVLSKSTNKQAYFIADSLEIVHNLLNSNDVENFKSIKIVIPFNQDNFFTFHSNRAIEVKNKFLELSTKIQFKFIFVLEKCKNHFEKDFIKFLDNAINNISINFVNYKDIAQYINSIDFILTDKKSFVIAKNLRSEQSLYSIYTSDLIYEDYQSIYNKILSYSIEYKNFKENDFVICKSDNEIFNLLVGSWHLYIYGSQKFWSDILKIYPNTKVELISEDKVTDIGTIKLKKKQALIILEDIYNDNLLTISFDIHSKDRLLNAFIANVVAKKFGDDDDLLSFAIISKKPIKESEAKEILGNKDKALLSNEDIKNRLNEYIVSKFGYYKDR